MVRVSFNYKNLTNSKQEQFISNVKLTDIEIKKYGIQKPTYSWWYKLKHAIKNILNID